MSEASDILEFLHSLPELAEQQRTNPALFPCEGTCGQDFPAKYLMLAFGKLLCGDCLAPEAQAAITGR